MYNLPWNITAELERESSEGVVWTNSWITLPDDGFLSMESLRFTYLGPGLWVDKTSMQLSNIQ